MGKADEVIQYAQAEGLLDPEEDHEHVTGLVTLTKEGTQILKGVGGGASGVLIATPTQALIGGKAPRSSLFESGEYVVEVFPYERIAHYDEQYRWGTRWSVSLVTSTTEGVVAAIGSSNRRPPALEVIRTHLQGVTAAEDPGPHVPSPDPQHPAHGAKKARTPKAVQETRCTCLACGKIWHYGKRELTEMQAAALHNVGKSMMCCGGCIPAVLIKDKQVRDLNRCPECGSRHITQETVTHEVE